MSEIKTGDFVEFSTIRPMEVKSHDPSGNTILAENVQREKEGGYKSPFVLVPSDRKYLNIRVVPRPLKVGDLVMVTEAKGICEEDLPLYGMVDDFQDGNTNFLLKANGKFWGIPKDAKITRLVPAK